MKITRITDPQQMMPLTIAIFEARCPICGSDRARSKVCDADGTWWFVCDDQQDIDHGLIVLPDGTEREVSAARWYFNLAGELDFGTGEKLRLSHQELK